MRQPVANVESNFERGRRYRHAQCERGKPSTPFGGLAHK